MDVALAEPLISGSLYAGSLMLIALGLALIFGIMRVLNLAHGGFYGLGAYLAALPIAYLGGAPGMIVGQYLFMPAGALAIAFTLGALTERYFIRWTYGKSEALQLVVTFAIFMILVSSQSLIFGGEPYYTGRIMTTLGRVTIGEISYAVYQFVPLVTSLVILAGWYWLTRATRFGMVIRTVASEPEMASAMGIDTQRVYLWVFIGSTALAALAGALNAPLSGVSPGIGTNALIAAFSVVVIAGIGEVRGIVPAALLVGFAHAFAIAYAPSLSTVAPYLIMFGVLLFRPYGLFRERPQRQI